MKVQHTRRGLGDQLGERQASMDADRKLGIVDGGSNSGKVLFQELWPIISVPNIDATEEQTVPAGS